MKHAIYKANYGGYYSWEYIDDLKDCKNILGGYYLTQEDLPIIVNSRGGHCSFSMKDEGFVKIIECPDGQDPLTREQRFPKNSDNFEYGWIDLDGNTYNCGHEGHNQSARYLCEEFGYDTYRYERELEDRGWVKITASWHRGVLEKHVYSVPFFITKKQADTLFDLGLWDIDDVRVLIECSELKW